MQSNHYQIMWQAEDNGYLQQMNNLEDDPDIQNIIKEQVSKEK